MRLHRLRSVAAASCVLAALGAITLLAQYQVNRQIYGSGGASTGSVRYAPQYLGQQATGPSSTRLLPSEIRHAYVVSGALPSDIRMGQNRVGPLSPTGAIAYIPQAPN